jgi:putative flippase GtrA
LLAQVARFLAAGGAATAVHYVLLVGLVELGWLPPTPATCVSYVAAAALNYGLRCRFVFCSRAPHRRTVPRYLVVLGIGFGLNGSLMTLGAGMLGLPYGVVQVVATGLVTAWNFAAHWLWTFGGDAAAREPHPKRWAEDVPPRPAVHEGRRLLRASGPGPTHEISHLKAALKRGANNYPVRGKQG